MPNWALLELCATPRGIRHSRARRDAARGGYDRVRAGRAGPTWSAPEGGFFLWLTVPEGIDTRAMLLEAARNGVTDVPGSAFFHDGGGAHCLRLSYSSAPLERIGEAVRRLVETIRARA